MPIQAAKSLKRKISWSVVGLGLIAVGLLVAWLNQRQSTPAHAEARLPAAAGAPAASTAPAPAAQAAPAAKAVSTPLQLAPNYYDHLPSLTAVIEQFKPLSSSEIEAKILEVEHDLANQELVEKANAKTLDEAGYRELARLMQLSDALYNVKIERQLSALESDLGIKKKGA